MELEATLLRPQQPTWPNHADLDEVRHELAARPWLVRPVETESLKVELAEVANAKGFVLMGGPCAEPLNHRAEDVRALVGTIDRMRDRIEAISGIRPLPIFRAAGQFCKPRSNDTETMDGLTLPSFRGELVNGYEFSLPSRTPNPRRMLVAHHAAQQTKALLKQLASEQSPTAHEALLLDYELPQVVDAGNRTISTSANYLWIGDRTRQLNGAHVALCEKVCNPIGVKLGPATDPAEVAALCARLNPERIPGRLSLIPRLGARAIASLLPPIIQAVQAGDHEVLWILDPMHGNTINTPSGRKTRPFAAIQDEIDQFFTLSSQHGLWPGGIHLEMSGQPVTECLGGDVTALNGRFETLCDPRVNCSQSLAIATQVGRLLAGRMASR